MAYRRYKTKKGFGQVMHDLYKERCVHNSTPGVNDGISLYDLNGVSVFIIHSANEETVKVFGTDTKRISRRISDLENKTGFVLSGFLGGK